MKQGAQAARTGAARLAGCAAILGLGFGTAVAQYVGAQEAGGPLFTLGIDSTVSASDNHDLEIDPDGTTVLSETALSFGFESETRTQSFRFSFSDTLEFGDGPDAPAEAGFVGPNLSLDYARQGANARLTLGARMTTRDLDDDEDEVTSATDLVIDSGTLTTQTLNLGLETGLNAPVGTDLALSGNWRDYSDTTDAALYDSTTLTGSAALVLRPSHITEYRLSLSRTGYEAEDAQRTERTTDSLSLGVRRDLASVTSVTGQLGWTRIEETWRAAGLELPDDEGLTAALGLSHALPSGSISLNLSHDVTSAGGRSDLSLGRAFELPLGALDVTLGLSEVGSGGVEPTGRIAYRRDLPTRSLTLSLSSDFTVDDDSEVERRTSLDLGYGVELSPVDSLNLDLGYVWIEDEGTGDDVGRTTATARYTRALTPDWDLSTGYTHRLYDESGSDTARSNTIFLSLGREFSWRP